MITGHMWWRLEGQTPVPCEMADPRAAGHPPLRWTMVPLGDGHAVRISTVFLHLNHQFGDGPPLVFETMTFCASVPAVDDWQERYATWDAALAGHDDVVRRVEAVLAGDADPGMVPQRCAGSLI